MSDYITEDIQLKILKLLPVKTLLRFRCVCKWWKQTIDSQPFIEDHLALQKRCLIVKSGFSEYLVANPCELPSFDILSAPTPEGLRLVGTLHGIVCFFNEIQYNFLLWNPSIRRCITVKGGPSLDWEFCDEGVYMFDPCFGFWIDPLTKDFKIITVQFLDEDEDDECWVYSSIRGEWKQLPFGYDLHYYTKEVAPAVIMDGVGYWIVYYDIEADNEEDKWLGVTMLSFDFVKESFLEPVHGLSVKREWNFPALCDRNGALSLVYMDPNFSCDLFVRKGDKWVLADALLAFPIAKRCIWGMVEVKEKEKNNMMFLATTTSDDLLMFDNSDPRARASSWDLLRTKIKESNVVVANGFVESLIFPQDATVHRLDVASQLPIREGAFSSTMDVDKTQMFLDIDGVSRKRKLYELGSTTADSNSSQSQQVGEEVERCVQKLLPQMNTDFEERMAKLMAELACKVQTSSSQIGIQEGLPQMNATKAHIPELLAELVRVELARVELARAEAELARAKAELARDEAKQRIVKLVLAEYAKIFNDAGPSSRR